MIRTERALDLDGEGQLVASVLSKKVAAGSSHAVIDVPVGPTAKARTPEAAALLRERLIDVAQAFGMTIKVLLTEGSQPVGWGLGPALEASDVLGVLQNDSAAPLDLRDRSIALAGALIELGAAANVGAGELVARSVLADGRAWAKFQAICEAQGGMRIPPRAKYTHGINAAQTGRVASIDNRMLSRAAKLAGAPDAKAAGLKLHVHLGDFVERDQPLFTVHAENPGELAYALDYVATRPAIVGLVPS